MVVGDIDDPGAAANREAAECDGITGIELALAEAAAELSVRCGHREHDRAQENGMTGEAK